MNIDGLEELNNLLRKLDINGFESDEGLPDLLYLYQIDFKDEYEAAYFGEPSLTIGTTEDIPKAELELIVDKIAKTASDFDEFIRLAKNICNFIVCKEQYRLKATVTF